MCTFNIALDDALVSTARSSFQDERSMTLWMEEQISNLLRQYTEQANSEHLSRPRKHNAMMGVVADAENEEERRKDAEKFARKVCVDEEDFEEMKAHGFYMHEKPEFQTFASEDEELAYFDSLTEDDFLSEEETVELIEKWKNL